jgi:hypothetical protein
LVAFKEFLGLPGKPKEGAMGLSSSRFRTCAAIGIVLLAQLAAAQRGSSGSSSTTSRTVTPPRTATTPDASIQPVFVSGKVLLQGGGVLPEPVPIERVCNSVSGREGYTDT